MTSFRLILAAFAAFGAVLGHATHSPTVLVFGLAGLAPLLVKALAVPARAKAVFVLTAVAFGLVLAAGTHHDHDGPGPQRPAPTAVTCAEAAR